MKHKIVILKHSYDWMTKIVNEYHPMSDWLTPPAKNIWHNSYWYPFFWMLSLVVHQLFTLLCMCQNGSRTLALSFHQAFTHSRIISLPLSWYIVLYFSHLLLLSKAFVQKASFSTTLLLLVTPQQTFYCLFVPLLIVFSLSSAMGRATPTMSCALSTLVVSARCWWHGPLWSCWHQQLAVGMLDPLFPFLHTSPHIVPVHHIAYLLACGLQKCAMSLTGLDWARVPTLGLSHIDMRCECTL